MRPKRHRPSVAARRQQGTRETEWTPAKLTGLVAHYDSSVASTMTLVASGTDYVVAQWRDQTTKDNHLSTSNDYNRPIFESVGIGTGPAILADGSGSWLRKTAFNRGSNWTTYSVYWCGQAVSYTAGDMAWAYANAARFRETTIGGINTWQQIGFTTNTNYTVRPIYSASLWGTEQTGTQMRLWANTTLESAVADSGSYNDKSILDLFAWNTGLNFANMRMGAMWVTTQPLTDYERNKLHAYCVKKGWVTEWSFTAAESATILPESTVWVAAEGIETADSGTTVNAWTGSYGGVSSILTAAAAANRPAYFVTGGINSFPIMTFDGTDDALRNTTHTKGSDWTDYEVGLVGTRDSFGVSGDRWLSIQSSGGAPYFGIHDSSATSIQAYNSPTVGSTTDPDGIVMHWAARGASSTNSIYRRGMVENSVSCSITTRADGSPLSLGGASIAVSCAAITIYAMYAGPALSDYQRAYLRALLTNKTRVAC